MQKIYIELVFIDNFIVNLLILFLASLLTGSKKSWGRLAAAASVGGIYACTVLGAGGLPISFWVKAAVSAAMCLLAYYAKNERNFWKNICAFYVTSFVFAGAVYGITYCLGKPGYVGGSITFGPPAGCILAGLGAGVVILSIFGRVRRRTVEREKNAVEINISFGSRTAALKAFVDTGNMLAEPISGLGVVFISADAAKGLFDKKTLELLKCRGSRLTEKLRIIPVMTAAGPGLFYGMEIDSIILKGRNEGIKAVVCIARGSLAYGCGAVIGTGLFDKLMKGAGHDKVFCEAGSGMDIAANGNSAECGLYKREPGAASAAYTAGGKLAAAKAGEGRQVGQAGIDRA